MPEKSPAAPTLADRYDERVSDALKGASTDYIDKLMDRIVARLDTLGAAMRRTIVLFLGLAALYELISRAAVNQASFGGFTLSDLSLLRKTLPALIFFMWYEFCAYLMQEAELKEVALSITRLSHPRIWRRGLTFAVVPSSPAVLGSSPVIGRRSRLAWIAIALNWITLLVVGMFPPAYLLRITISELGAFDPDVVSVIALVIAGLFAVYGWVLLFATETSYNLEPTDQGPSDEDRA